MSDVFKVTIKKVGYERVYLYPHDRMFEKELGKPCYVDCFKGKMEPGTKNSVIYTNNGGTEVRCYVRHLRAMGMPEEDIHDLEFDKVVYLATIKNGKFWLIERWNPPTPKEVRAARDRLGMSQHEVAGWFGVNRSLVSFWETGYRCITPKYWAMLEAGIS